MRIGGASQRGSRNGCNNGNLGGLVHGRFPCCAPLVDRRRGVSGRLVMDHIEVSGSCGSVRFRGMIGQAPTLVDYDVGIVHPERFRHNLLLCVGQFEFAVEAPLCCIDHFLFASSFFAVWARRSRPRAFSFSTRVRPCRAPSGIPARVSRNMCRSATSR